MIQYIMKLETKKIKKYLQSDKYDFKVFSLGLSDSEKETIDNYKLEKDKVYNHFGSVDKITNMKEYLSEVGTNKITTINRMYALIIRLIKKVLISYNEKNFWLAIRISTPNNLYNIPRWHKDGRFFPSDPTEQATSKFVAVLKGPGTLLIKCNKEVNTIYTENFEKEKSELTPSSTIEESIKVANKYRPILAKKLAKKKVVQIKNSQGLIFFTGVPIENGALHSEPPTSEPRMFISILPNSETNIMALQKRWSK